jgi:hypothetical protein
MFRTSMYSKCCHAYVIHEWKGIELYGHCEKCKQKIKKIGEVIFANDERISNTEIVHRLFEIK